MEINKEDLKQMLYSKHKTQLLSTKQAAEELNKSKTTLGRWKKKGIHLSYKQDGSVKNAPVFYTLDAIVDYIVDNNTKIV